jgi:hypothetical protein
MICIQDLDTPTCNISEPRPSTFQEAARSYFAGFAELLEVAAKDVRAGEYGRGFDLDIARVMADIKGRMAEEGYFD